VRALVISGLGQTRFTDIAKPALMAGEVEVLIRHIGICGSDLNTFRGTNPLVTLPRIPGHEISGVVAALGAGVQGLAIGQRVTVLPYTSCGICTACRVGRVNACRYNRTLGVQQNGALTERITVASASIISNDTLPARHLALVEPLSVGFHAVWRGRVAPAERVLVIGFGMIGAGAVLGAVQRGAEVTVVDPSPAKRALALGFGVSQAVDPAHAATELERIAAGDGFDVVIEAVGLPETFTQAVEQASYAGRVVYIGYCKAPVTYQTQMFNLKELDILGSRNAVLADFEAAIGWLEAVGSSADQLISRAFSFDQANEALPFFAANRDTTLKVMVDYE